MGRIKTHVFWTYVLVGINVWLGILLAKYSWNTNVLLAWGGMNAHMPQVQALVQLPPFADMSQATLNKLPHFMYSPMSGTILLIVRSIWASFLHFSWAHLGSNMMVLFLMGRMFEESNYPGIIVPVYLFTGSVSMVSAFYFQSAALTAGASGAIFGIMGAGYVLYLRSKPAFRKATIDTEAANRYARLGNYVYSLIVLNIISTFMTPGISIIGHIAGLVSGLLVGLIIPLKRH